MVQNKIYQNFIKEILKTFFIILLGLSLIAWTVRAVNFLDLIVESGYSVSTYFQYSFLNLFGILTKFIPLSFLLALIIFVLKQIQENEFIILWTSGVKKIKVVNVFFTISSFVLIFYLICATIITPVVLNKSRVLIGSQGFNSFLPTIRVNQFSDSFQGFTFMVEKKFKNEIQNVFIHDRSNTLKNLTSEKSNKFSTTILSEKGIVGGYSLKPARFMEDMTYDMAGSATVVGLMKNLALRKAKVNAVGVVGLVENMVSGNAQRPGDIVKSYSGKTIEVLNTDAEGRLVLADALTFTEKKFKPKFIIDLATLTGAIIVCLGSEYAGLFSNDDKLSKQIFEAGEKVEEKVWRMPLHKNYDKLMNSKNADMQNINYVGGAGSTTAAQFLQRFILNKTPWAHLDIAGMAFSKYGGALNSKGATGFGVRLLNQLIEENYE